MESNFNSEQRLIVMTEEQLQRFAGTLANELLTKHEAKKAEKEEAERLIPIEEAMDALGVARSTLWRWEKNRYLVPIRQGVKVRYRVGDINKIKEGAA